jgi:branched-chain amino acid aminotransferase
LRIEKTQHPKAKGLLDELQFGRTFSDHMLEIDWDEGHGWQAPRIIPYQNLSIPPGATALHYGIEVGGSLYLYLEVVVSSLFACFLVWYSVSKA